MRRRTFIAGLASAAAWPMVGRAQQAGKIARIGILGPNLNNSLVAAAHEILRSRLRTLGFVEGQQIARPQFGEKHERVSIYQ